MPTAQTWRSWSTVASTRTTSAGGRRQGSSRGPAAGGPDRRPRYDDFDNRSRRRAMATDLTIALVDRPGSLAKASDVLGRAGGNIEGAAGYVCEGEGGFPLLALD